ncbi:MAG: 4-(cytidine 5'-diphospho)-2-C-methyl-D-erythritol kinase [Oscillospiraceae bacterium]|nr:4-(cytidine 5'-diphospho)-2-C-methyl-D-erythritol kinase [Oscillospiraceae bacterium]
MKIKCYAKINLSLDVTGKTENGYHNLDSIFQLVSVYDILNLSVTEGDGIDFTCDNPEIPCDEKNLAYQAAKLLLEYSGKKAKIIINLEKHIPSGAGMGGGSADCAGVLYGLNKLLNLNYSNQELRNLGVQLGADVPFFLLGGTAFAQGIGEMLTALKPLQQLPLVILKGKESISTPEAYRAIDKLENPVHPDTKSMLQAIATQDKNLLCQSCANLFESVIDCQDVMRAKTALLKHGAKCAVMTGSGSAVFGIFENQESAQVCEEKLKQDFVFVQACLTEEKNFTEIQEVLF